MKVKDWIYSLFPEWAHDALSWIGHCFLGFLAGVLFHQDGVRYGVAIFVGKEAEEVRREGLGNQTAKHIVDHVMDIVSVLLGGLLAIWLLGCTVPTEPQPKKSCEFVVTVDSLPYTFTVDESCSHYVVPWPFP